MMHKKIEALGSTPLAIGGVENHVHLLVKMDGRLAVPDFVRVVKVYSAKFLNEINPENYIFSWQDGYSVFSVSSSAVTRASRYIYNQEEHHKACSFDDEMEVLGRCEQVGLK